MTREDAADFAVLMRARMEALYAVQCRFGEYQCPKCETYHTRPVTRCRECLHHIVDITQPAPSALFEAVKNQSMSDLLVSI